MNLRIDWRRSVLFTVWIRLGRLLIALMPLYWRFRVDRHQDRQCRWCGMFGALTVFRFYRIVDAKRGLGIYE